MMGANIMSRVEIICILPLMIDNHVIDAGNITKRTIDLHLAVPTILAEQLVLRTNGNETHFLAGVMALDEKSTGHTKVLARQLENLTAFVVLAQLERNGRDHMVLTYIDQCSSKEGPFPEAPSNLVVSERGLTSITIGWQNNSEIANTFQIWTRVVGNTNPVS